MTINSVLLFAPAESAGDDGVGAYAISLAKAHGAKLTMFVVNLDVTTPGRYADAAAIVAPMKDAALAAGLDCVTITEHSHAIGVYEVVAEHARLHDLTVMGCRSDGMLSERTMLEHLLFDSGRPVLVVPAEHRQPFSGDTVAVAWDNSRSAARALGDAKPLIATSDLVLLTIDGDKQMRGDLAPDELVATLARRGLRARAKNADRGARTIGDALQDEALAEGAQLLVMGGYGHSNLRRFVLGSATADLFDRPRMPVLMSH